MEFIIDEQIAVVPICEALLVDMILVLPHSRYELRGHSDIECAIFCTRKYIDISLLFFHEMSIERKSEVEIVIARTTKGRTKRSQESRIMDCFAKLAMTGIMDC